MNYTLLQKIQIFFIKLMAKVRWKQDELLSEDDLAYLRQQFTDNYFIIASRRSNYLSTFFIGLGHWFLTGRWGYYTHVLMNLEDEVKTDDDFRFIEATGTGTHYDDLRGITHDVDAIALLKPTSMTVEEWTACLDKAKNYLGVPYDNLFNLKNTLEVNCVELVRLALQALPDYDTRFASFEAMIQRRHGKLTPQMFLECEDFHVVWEVRK